jgi:hypothetical protein
MHPDPADPPLWGVRVAEPPARGGAPVVIVSVAVVQAVASGSSTAHSTSSGVRGETGGCAPSRPVCVPESAVTQLSIAKNATRRNQVAYRLSE